MPEALPIVIPGTGGRTGETLLILGVLGGGAYLLWRKGFFDKPTRVSSPALRMPTGGLTEAKPRPVMESPAPTSSALMSPPTPAPPMTEAQKNLAGQGVPSELARKAIKQPPPAAKPPPVAAPALSVSAAPLVSVPSPFGKVAAIKVGGPVAAPPPLAPPPMMATKPAPVVAPVTLAKPAAVKPAFSSSFGGISAKPAPLTVGFRK